MTAPLTDTDKEFLVDLYKACQQCQTPRHVVCTLAIAQYATLVNPTVFLRQHTAQASIAHARLVALEGAKK